MGKWRAVALPRVSRELVSRALDDLGTSWTGAAHVTATTTLAGGIRETGVVGMPLATLMDLFVMPGLPGPMALPVDGFPGPEVLLEGTSIYRQRARRWQEESSGRRLRVGIQVDDSLRRFVREEADDATGRALVASRREYARTVHALIAAGVRPAALRPRDRLARVAARAWHRAERDVLALGAPRDLLWVDFGDLEAGVTSEARDVLLRVRSALRTAFGVRERWTVVHHGFYFFTPPQWAMFQVLQRIPEVDQVFVVHDDGENPAFSTWRHYFRSEWAIPVPTLMPYAEQVTPAAAAFRAVLAGAEDGDLSDVEVRECRSPTELVRLWQDEDSAVPDAEQGPLRYGASAKDVERFVQRLGRSTNMSSPRLAQLPVGSFLMSLHGCIRQSTDGKASVDLTSDALLDMIASGFLELPADAPQVSVSTVRRALPYFSGCRTSEQWLERAGLLRRAVQSRVSPLGARQPDVTDAERIGTAVANPTRLVPWGDLTEVQAAAIENMIQRVVTLVEETVARERIVLGEHLDRVRTRLERALRALPAQERDAIEAKLRGFGVFEEEEIDVGGLVDVVAMLLGRTADFEPDVNGEAPDTTAVVELRGLDVLGLSRADRDLHLANLGEDVFPANVGVVGWPFDLEDLRRSGDEAVEPVTMDLLAVRGATGALSDLYLFWLALDGAEGGRRITLSWLSDAAGDRRRLSPLVTLLTTPEVRSEAIRSLAGGLEIQPVRSAADLPAVRPRPEPVIEQVAEDEVRAALERLDPRATTAAMACPRRFAIQWAMGPSASFGPEYQQTMLYGNLSNALVRGAQENAFGATATANDLWPHLTHGQRRSSLDKSVVKPSGPSADPTWLLTLAGSGTGHRPLDRAYQAAKELVPADEDEIAPPDARFLPRGIDDPEVCSRCPVQARCHQWTAPER